LKGGYFVHYLNTVKHSVINIFDPACCEHIVFVLRILNY
jgi:hypothetical protein